MKRKRGGSHALAHATSSSAVDTSEAGHAGLGKDSFNTANGQGDRQEQYDSDRETSAVPQSVNVEFSTPRKHKRRIGATNISQEHTADRSARRKSTRHLISSNGVDDEDDVNDAHELAQRIWSGRAESEGASDGDSHNNEQGLLPETPTKPKRAYQKRQKKARTPTPPRDMPACEHYFFQNRPGGSRTSDNTLSSLSLLTHEEYYNIMRQYKDQHQEELNFLQTMHQRSFDQWHFEIEEGFNLCMYGWGSKLTLLNAFAQYLGTQDVPPRIVVVNGHIPSLTIRDVLTLLASMIPSLSGRRLGAQPADVLSTIASVLASTNNPERIVLIIHSIDGSSLRRTATPSILASLASLPSISLVCSANTPNFPLLWDASLKTRFNFLFHDSTTFHSFDVELGIAEGGVVDEVNALFGRSGRRLHGREGVVFVLRSLTDSARRLYSLLIAEILSVDPVERGYDQDRDQDDDDDDNDFIGQIEPPRQKQAQVSAIDYRTLYRKAVSQLIATNEIQFRQLLKEFYDHEMLETKKDGLGAETLTVPFRQEECEAILDDLAIGR